MNAELKKFEEDIGYPFQNKDLLKQAFVHRSYLNENRDFPLPHNERLEFLGDAVLELVTTEFLFDKYPAKTEGELTSYRAAMVNTIILSETASSLGMNDHLLLSKGESRDTGRARQYILANTFESLVGSIYLDGGYEEAKKFIIDNLLFRADNIVESGIWRDSKSKLQEIAQDKLSVTPSYSVLKEEGPDHDRIFTVGVYLGEELVVEAKGKSKQEAEQNAAEMALRTRGWN